MQHLVNYSFCLNIVEEPLSQVGASFMELLFYVFFTDKAQVVVVYANANPNPTNVTAQITPH